MYAKKCYVNIAKYRLSVVIEKDAIRLHIEDRIANKEEIPKSETSLSTIEIEA